MMKKKIIFAALIVVFSASVFFVPFHGTPAAFAAAGVFIPFGGDIKSITTCNEGLLLYLGLPSPFPVVVPYGPTYAYNSLHPGAWVLGLGAGFSPCTIGPTVVGGGVLVIRGPLIFIGTSF